MVFQNYSYPMVSLPSLARSQKYEELSYWQLAEKQISQYDVAPIEKKVRKIRLDRMFQKMRARLKNSKPREASPKPDPFEKLKDSRKLGNEFSQSNRFAFFSNFYRVKLRGIKKAPDSEELSKMKARKSYGNKKSDENRKKMKRINLFISEDEYSDIVEDRVINRTHEYGKYYSNRFKLKNKMKRADYDIEFQELIMECLDFEKSHSGVTSVIEEIINSNKSLKAEMTNIQKLMIKTEDNSLKVDESKIHKTRSKPEENEDLLADRYSKVLFEEEGRKPMVIPDPPKEKAPDIFINLKPSPFVQDLSEEDDTSDSESFASLTKILGTKESNTRSYKYSIENNSLVSIEKPTDNISDIDESKAVDSVRSCCSQVTNDEELKESSSNFVDESKDLISVQPCCSQYKDFESIDFDYSKKAEGQGETNNDIFGAVKSKILEDWNFEQDSLLNSGMLPITLEGKHSEGTLQKMCSALINKN